MVDAGKAIQRVVADIRHREGKNEKTKAQEDAKLVLSLLFCKEDALSFMIGCRGKHFL